MSAMKTLARATRPRASARVRALSTTLLMLCAALASLSIASESLSGKQVATDSASARQNAAQPPEAIATAGKPVSESSATKTIAFGWSERIGPEGRGIQTVGIEWTRIRSDDLEQTYEIFDSRDVLTESTSFFRVHQGRTQIQRTGDDHLEYHYEPNDTRRVTVTIDGDSVSHLNEGIGPRNSPGIPDTIPNAILLDDGLVICYQLAIDRFSKDKKLDDFDGFRFDAIVPPRLAQYHFSIHDLGRETLKLDRGPQQCHHLEFRMEDRVGAPKLPPELYGRRELWVNEAGEIVRFVIPNHRRHQGTAEGYNLAYHGGHGCVSTQSEATDVGIKMAQWIRSTGRYGGMTTKPGVGLIILHDDTVESRRVVNATRWVAAERGLDVLTLAIGNVTVDDAKVLGTAIERLTAGGSVDRKRIVLMTVGRVRPKLPLIVGDHGLLGWVTVNGFFTDSPDEKTAEAALNASQLPILCVYGAAAQPLDAQAAWAGWLTKKYAEHSEARPIDGVDASFGAVSAQTGDPCHGLAKPFVETLEAWFGKRLE